MIEYNAYLHGDRKSVQALKHQAWQREWSQNPGDPLFTYMDILNETANRHGVVALRHGHPHRHGPLWANQRGWVPYQSKNR